MIYLENYNKKHKIMAQSKSVLKDRSFAFAVEIVKCFKKMTENKREFVLSKQLLRSGTSIGANVREAKNAESTNDFIHKLGVAQKESDETLYWLELLEATDYLETDSYIKLSGEADQLLKMIRSSILTVKQNRK
jgi:four helix bundle protein